MMKLLDVIIAGEGRISGGSEYGWRCFGDNARILDLADVNGDEICTVVFDCKTYDVYTVDLFVPNDDQCFIWFNAEHKDRYVNECRVRDVDPLKAFDNVYFLEVDQVTMIEYLKDISSAYYDSLPILDLS